VSTAGRTASTSCFLITEERRSPDGPAISVAGEIGGLLVAPGRVTLREERVAKACAGSHHVEEILRVTH